MSMKLALSYPFVLLTVSLFWLDGLKNTCLWLVEWETIYCVFVMLVMFIFLLPGDQEVSKKLEMLGKGEVNWKIFFTKSTKN